MPFINNTDLIGIVIEKGTQNSTGSLVVTLLLLLIVLLAICLMLSIPIEFASVILLPLCITTASYLSNFLAPLIVILIYASTIIAKNWIFK